MAKFGDLISSEIPVLLCFYNSEIDTEQYQLTLAKVASDFSTKIKVIKIDVDKNTELSEALKVKSCPSFILYHNEEMIWRTSDYISSEKLTETLHQFVS